MLTCGQQCSRDKVLYIPRCRFVQCVLSLLIPAVETQETFSSQIKLRLFKPFAARSLLQTIPWPLFSCSTLDFFFFLPPIFWLTPSLFSFSLFHFLTKARTGRHMIRLPLIGIRFTGLDQHPAGCSQSIAHICTESGSLRTRVCRAVWPTIRFSLQSRKPAITHGALGQTSCKHTHVWQLSCESQTLIRGPPYWHLSWFVSTLTVKKQDSWDDCSVTERTDQCGG